MEDIVNVENIKNNIMKNKKNKKNNNNNTSNTSNISNTSNAANNTTNNTTKKNSIVKKEKKTKNTSGLRTFKLADPLIVHRDLHGKVSKSKDSHGKYSDLTPGGAARKVFRRIARSRQLGQLVKDGRADHNGKLQKINNYGAAFKGADKNVVFCLIELDDDGGEVKRFYYKGSNKLDQPIMNKFIGFNIKTGKKKTSIQWVLPSIHSISKEEYEAKIKNQL